MALGAVLAPWLSVGMIALHLGAHPDGDHGDDAAAVAVAFHGHRHDAATPDHQHVLTLPALTPVAVKANLAIPSVAVLRSPAQAALTVVAAAAWVSGVGHDPPPGSRSFSILRI